MIWSISLRHTASIVYTFVSHHMQYRATHIFEPSNGLAVLWRFVRFHFFWSTTSSLLFIFIRFGRNRRHFHAAPNLIIALVVRRWIGKAENCALHIWYDNPNMYTRHEARCEQYRTTECYSYAVYTQQLNWTVYNHHAACSTYTHGIVCVCVFIFFFFGLDEFLEGAPPNRRIRRAQRTQRQKKWNSKTTATATANATRECKLNGKLFRFAQFPRWLFLLCNYAANCECNQWTVEHVALHFHPMNFIAFSLNRITLISRAIALIAFTIERSFGRPEEIQTNFNRTIWVCSIFMGS